MSLARRAPASSLGVLSGPLMAKRPTQDQNGALLEDLETLSVDEAKQYIAEGHFAPGSMLPKIEAAVKFVESKPGRVSIITSLDKAVEALEGKAGTTVK